MNRRDRAIFLAIPVAAALAVGGAFFALAGDSKDILVVGEPVLPEASSQEANYPSGNDPTIKVTGSAVMMLEPDQATIGIAMRSQPTNITSALAQQEQETESLVGAIRDAVGEGDDSTEIEQGSFGLRQYYTGQESYSSIEMFTVRSTVSIETDIEQFSKVVSRLTGEGYTFESVYAGPRFQSSFASASASLGAADADAGAAGDEPGGGEGTEDEYGQIMLNVAISTRPASIDEAVEAYEEKHQRLLQILAEEMGIPLEKIQPASVNIDPLYHGPPNQGLLYTYYSQILVSTNPENIAKIISAVDPYDVFVEDVLITMSDKQLAEIEGELNLAAFNNAKAKAEEIAGMTGLGIGGVQSIESVTEPIEQRRAFYGNLYSADAWRYTDTWKVGATVTAEFELTR